MEPNSPLAYSLSTEDQILIRTACKVVQSENKQTAPFRFWGRVFGTQNDYYVIQSTIVHPARNTHTCYSRDARVWQTLPPVKELLKKRKPRLHGMFTGDPTFNSNFVEYRYAGEDYYEPLTMSVKEEERLAYLVYCIDSEGMLFPKGSCGINDKGFLIQNPYYDGMSYAQCRDLNQYLLFKPLTVDKNDPAYGEIAVEDPAHGVLVPLADTLPSNNLAAYGAWHFRDCDETCCVVLENVQWPGLYFWHQLDSVHFGRCYLGRGEKDIDVPFIYGSVQDQESVVDVSVLPDYDYKALPEEAIRRAEEDFTAEERRLERLLPPLPVKILPTIPKIEIDEGGGSLITEDTTTREEGDESVASTAPTSAAVTEVTTDQEATSAEESESEA